MLRVSAPAAPSGRPARDLCSADPIWSFSGQRGRDGRGGDAHYAGRAGGPAFVCSRQSRSRLLAALVGRCVERLGDRLGAGATGVLQSALGNLPELFIAFFALRQGLLAVVQAAIIGSILANLLLVLGAAFIVGGLKHGTQRFAAGRARTTVVLLALATAALVLPSLAAHTHSPAAHHEKALSVAVAIVLLVIFGAVAAGVAAPRRAEAGRRPATENSVGRRGARDGHARTRRTRGPLADLARGAAARRRGRRGRAGLRLVRQRAAARRSSRCTSRRRSPVWSSSRSPATRWRTSSASSSPLRNQADYALSVIINSPLQIALVLAPLLVLLSFFTATTLTLVFAPLLVVAVVVSVLHRRVDRAGRRVELAGRRRS